MRKPLLAPVNGRRSDIKGDHLKASVRQRLSIITQPTPNYEGELSFALNVSAIKPMDEVGITDHLSPVDGLLISLSLRVQSFKPACCIPPLHKLLGELSGLCSRLLFHLASPVFSRPITLLVSALTVDATRFQPSPPAPGHRRAPSIRQSGQ